LPLDIAHPQQEYLSYVKCLLPLKSADVLLLYVSSGARGLEGILTSVGKNSEQLGEEVKGHSRTILDGIGDKLKPFSQSVISLVVEAGERSLASTIEAVAADANVDLIALGATQNHADTSYYIGSNAAHVVKYAPGAVLMVRGAISEEESTFRVLIAVDGSAQALRAIKTFASQFATGERRLAVTLLNVVSIVGIWKFISPVEFVAAIEDNLNIAAETILAEADKALSQCKLTPVNLIIRSGEPANEIMKAARDIKAHLIVAGAHGKSAVEQFFLGSVSHKLSMHAPCSTLIVK